MRAETRCLRQRALLWPYRERQNLSRNNLVLKHDRDSYPRQRIFLNLLLREFFEFLNRVSHLLGRDVRFFLCGCAKRRQQNQQ